MMKMNINRPFITRLLLQVGVALYLIGLFNYYRTGGAISTLLFMDFGVNDNTAVAIERSIGWAILLLVPLFILKNQKLNLIAFILIALVAFFTAVIIQHNGGQVFNQWIIVSHMARFSLPLVAFLHFLEYNSTQYLAKKIAIFSISITFAVHGLEAWLSHPQFIDYFIGSSQNLLGIKVNESAAISILKFIGLLDVASALMILIYPNKPIVLWMLIWGLVTALSRMGELGIGMYNEVLIRSAHFILPTFIYFTLSQNSRS